MLFLSRHQQKHNVQLMYWKILCDIEKCNKVGMNDHIDKPLDEDEIFYVIPPNL
ncbi:MAG: hypothetical protein IME94_07225 [Proteobacteria bacterium]|nr:hypothetical protein [Pseudomonadota bacterium]